MSEAIEHTTHFSVNGMGLTRLCRKIYVFEEDEYGAIKILQWLHGITMDQIRSVCTGHARLEDQPDGTIMYVQKPDPVFISAAEAWYIYKKTVLIPERQRKKEELLEFMETIHNTPDEELLNTIRLEIKKNGNKYLKEAGHPNATHICTERQYLLPRILNETYGGEDLPSTRDNLQMFLDDTIPFEPKPDHTETIELGGKKVPKNLLDRYANHTVKSLRESMRRKWMPTSTEGVMAIYDLEMERQDLHDAICEAVGLKGQGHDHGDTRTDEYQKFNSALSDYLDKHAGTLFNGDGD